MPKKEIMMIEAFSTKRNRIRTFILLAVCGLLAITAAVVGIDDNPPGILSAFLAITVFVLTFVHPWRTARKFLRLLYASALGLVVFGFIFIGLDISTSKVEGSGLVHGLLSAGSALFLIATAICPSGVLIGAVGAVVMAIRNRRQPTPGPKTTA
jgi:hypothetical protein